MKRPELRDSDEAFWTETPTSLAAAGRPIAVLCLNRRLFVMRSVMQELQEHVPLSCYTARLVFDDRLHDTWMIHQQLRLVHGLQVRKSTLIPALFITLLSVLCRCSETQSLYRIGAYLSLDCDRRFVLRGHTCDRQMRDTFQFGVETGVRLETAESVVKYRKIK